MNNQEGKIWYGIGLDSSQLDKDSRKANNLLKGIGDEAQKQSGRIDSGFKNAFAFAGATAATATIGILGTKILETTAKFEKFGIVLRNTLGEKEGNSALDMIAKFAATTPFQLDEVTAAFIKMSNQGFVPTREQMIKLGDVASSTGKSFDQLTEALLDAQTGQFERLKEFGIKAASQGDKVTFSFKEQQTTVDNTNTAIQKYILSLGELKGIQGANALISESLTGQLSNLEDKLAAMYNNIGKSNSGLLYTTVGAGSTLIENYEQIGKAILGVVAVYGTYKAAIIVSNAVQASQIAINELVVASGGLVNAKEAMSIIIKDRLTLATLRQTAAQLGLNMAVLSNPYVLATMAVVAFSAAVWVMYDSTTAAERAQKALNERIAEQSKNTDSEIALVEKNIQAIKDETTTRVQKQLALNALQSSYPDIFKNLNVETAKHLELAEAIKLVNIELEKKNGKKDANDLSTIQGLLNAPQGRMDIGAARNMLGDKVHWYDDGAKVRELLNAEKDAILQKQSSEKAAKKQAEFDALSGKEKVNYLKKQNEELERQKKLLSAGGELSKIPVSLINDSIDKNNVVINGIINPKKEVVSKTPAQIKKEQEAKKKADAENERLRKGALAKLKSWQKQENETKRKLADEELALLRSKINDKKDLIDLDYEQTIDSIKQDEEVAKKLATDAGKVFDNSDFVKRRKVAYKKRVSDKLLVDAEKLKAEKEKLDELLLKYQDYTQKKLTLDKDFTVESAKLAGNPKALAQATKTYKKNLSELQNELLDENGRGLADLYLFGDGEEFIQKKIKAAFPEIKNFSDLTVSELEKIKKYVGEIQLTPEQIEAFKQLGIDVEKLQNNLKSAKSDSGDFFDKEKWAEIIDEVSKLAGSIGELGDSLQGFGGVLGDIGGALSGISSNFGDIAASFDPKSSKSDIASAGISGLASLIGMVANQIEENKKAQEDWNAKIAEGQHQMALMRIEAAAYQETNIFGVENPYAKAIAGMEQYALASKELYDKTNELSSGQVQTGTKKVVDWGNVGAGVGAGAAVGAAVGSFIPVIGNLVGAGIGALVGGIVGLAATKTEPVFESLKDKYGEVVDANGNLNKELLADYDKLDEKTKGLIDNWQEIKAKQEEAQKQMEENFKSLAGDLGSSLSDALVEAFKNNELYSAIDKFDAKMNEVISGIVEQLIFNTIFGQMFSDLEAKFKESFSAGGDQSLVDDLVNFGKDYKTGIDAYNEAMTLANKEMQNSGLAGFGTNARTALTKGITQASQDSVSELNGRFTVMTMHTSKIVEDMAVLRINSSQSLKHLAGIETNTARLEAVENGIMSIKSGIENINLKGIKLQ